MSNSGLRSQLDVLDGRYAAVLALTPEAHALLTAPERVSELRDVYRRVGFVCVPGVVDADALAKLADTLWPILSQLAFRVTVPHVIRDDGELGSGGRLRRVDVGSLDPAGQGRALDGVLRGIGLYEFGRILSDDLASVVSGVVGNVSYERIFANLYEEGDYLTPHNDAHIGSRVDVNLSTTLNGTCGLRVLTDGHFETHYDGDGAIGILGPGVWHEVPPLLRTGPPPRRLTLTLRYVPA